MKVAVAVDSRRLETGHLCSSKSRPMRANANQCLDFKSVGVNAQLLNTILSYANVPVGRVGVTSTKENLY
jgi:hypothetical protein